MYKILLIDGDLSNLETVKEILIIYDYDVLTVKNVEEALYVVEHWMPHLLLCDSLISEKDGNHFYHLIAKSSILSSVPTIFLSVNQDQNVLQNSVINQADYYVNKPFIIDELLSVIKKKIQEKLFVPEINPQVKRSLMGKELSECSNSEEEELSELCTTTLYSEKKQKRFLHNKFLYQEYLDNNLIFEKDTTTNITLTLLKTLNKLSGINSIYKKRIVQNIISAYVNIKETYLEFILYELIENALKFSNKNVVKITGKIIAHKYYELTIKDNGIGFTPEELLEIESKYELNFKLLQEKDLGGLFLSTKFIEKAEGIINITSEKNRGTTVTLYFPITNPQRVPNPSRVN